MALAVHVDTIGDRAVLVPAAMRLAGRVGWWTSAPLPKRPQWGDLREESLVIRAV
jgi:uncharacterized membrane protein YdfJ with MMPL/SSD domain